MVTDNYEDGKVKVAALIPAYNPSGELIPLVNALSRSDFSTIIVVNDGSDRECDSIFAEIGKIDKVVLLRHAVNLGKGAALKTGLNYAYCYFADHVGVVTIDADGQHLIEDSLKIAEELKKYPDNLIMGVRNFDDRVPLRSKLGNTITKYLFRFLIGHKLTDTQSGLRGIPRSFIPGLLKIGANGYEFELDMLLACKYSGRRIIEQPITTVYIDQNRSSHFNPFFDSLKIYFVLFRFSLAAIFSAVIDNTVFILIYSFSNSIATSQIAARAVSMIFNYSAVKKVVFYSDLKHGKTFPKYLSLVVVSGFVSYLLIKAIIMFSPLSVIPAKLVAESIVFLANFAIQRDFIFAHDKNTAEVKNA
jgi:glycosyltransferase involved in cell wall biosynthesis